MKANLARFEQEDSDGAEVKVDEVFRFVSHIRAKVAANYTVPGWTEYY